MQSSLIWTMQCSHNRHISIIPGRIRILMSYTALSLTRRLQVQTLNFLRAINDSSEPFYVVFFVK